MQGGASAAAAATGPADMDFATMLATFPAEVREEVLLTSDESMLSSLTPALLAEAQAHHIPPICPTVDLQWFASGIRMWRRHVFSERCIGICGFETVEIEHRFRGRWLRNDRQIRALLKSHGLLVKTPSVESPSRIA